MLPTFQSNTLRWLSTANQKPFQFFRSLFDAVAVKASKGMLRIKKHQPQFRNVAKPFPERRPTIIK